MIQPIRRTLATAVLLCTAAIAPFAAPLSAQDRASSLQTEAREKFRVLHERMQKLQLLKAQTDPEEGDLLAKGNRFVQERDLPGGMSEVQELIDGGQYDEALERMEGLQADLGRLLDLLLNRDVDLEKLLERIEELEKYKERVEKLIEEQEDEKEAAARAEALAKHLRELEAAKEKVSELIEEQEALREEAKQNGLAAQPDKAEKMAENQGDLKKDAEELAEKLENIEKDAEKLKGAGEPKSGEPKSGEPKSGEPKSGEPKSGAPKSGKPKDGQPKDSKPKDGKPGEGSCSGSCQGAAGSMGKSQKKLQQNKPERSLEDMDRAIAELKKTQAKLEEMSEEARRKLLELPFEQQARAQETTRVDTDRLAQDMEADDREGDSQGNPQKTPGKKNIQQAVPKQKAAAGQLKDFKPGKAKQEQQDALDELNKAKQALEDALAQLRQELQDEVLRALEERFGAMLAKQKELSARTKAVDRLASGSLAASALPAAVKRRATEISRGEFELAGEASDALKLLEEEGSTAAFPAVVEILRDDLNAVAKRIGKFKTGKTSQSMQAEIEQMLKDLLNALRKQIEMNEGGGQCGQCNGQPPLVPMSAELKLVMIKQKRVNKRTAAYDTDVPEQLRVTDEAKDEATVLSQSQGQVEDLLRKIAMKLNKEASGN